MTATIDPVLNRSLADYDPLSVLQAQGSVLTNKYAEGYPGRRYGGCEHVDVLEQLAIDRVGALFGAGFAHVQPHSGAQANAAAMAALVKPGDKILGLSLTEVSEKDFRVDMAHFAGLVAAPSAARSYRLSGSCAGEPVKRGFGTEKLQARVNALVEQFTPYPQETR